MIEIMGPVIIPGFEFRDLEERVNSVEHAFVIAHQDSAFDQQQVFAVELSDTASRFVPAAGWRWDSNVIWLLKQSH